MNFRYFLYAAAIVMAVSCVPQGRAATGLSDPRFCGEPSRDASGTIVRSSKVLSDFQKLHPCPATGLAKGACPGWAKDHVIPLACGGCDAVWNLQWLPDDQKSVAGAHAKDRFERKIYYPLTPTPGTDACVKELVQ